MFLTRSLSHNHVTEGWLLSGTTYSTENPSPPWLGSIVRDTFLKSQIPIDSDFPLRQYYLYCFYCTIRIFFGALETGFCELSWEHKPYFIRFPVGRLQSDFQTTNFQKKSCQCLSWEIAHPLKFTKVLGQNYNWQLVIHVQMFMSVECSHIGWTFPHHLIHSIIPCKTLP